MLNLARLEGERHVAIYNAMLGKLATEGPTLTDKVKPFKDEELGRILARHLKSAD